MNKEKQEYIFAWIKKASNDLQNASIVLNANENEKPFDTVCFHCQQAAEKYLKAYLVFLNIMFTKTHNIGQLISLGLENDPDLESLMHTDELSPYGVNIRYPDDFEIPLENDAKRAFLFATEVKSFVLNKIKKLYENFS